MNWWLLLLISLVVYSVMRWLLPFTPLSDFAQGYVCGVIIMTIFSFKDKT